MVHKLNGDIETLKANKICNKRKYFVNHRTERMGNEFVESAEFNLNGKGRECGWLRFWLDMINIFHIHMFLKFLIMPKNVDTFRSRNRQFQNFI